MPCQEKAQPLHTIAKEIDRSLLKKLNKRCLAKDQVASTLHIRHLKNCYSDKDLQVYTTLFRSNWSTASVAVLRRFVTANSPVKTRKFVNHLSHLCKWCKVFVVLNIEIRNTL